MPRAGILDRIRRMNRIGKACGENGKNEKATRGEAWLWAGGWESWMIAKRGARLC